MIKTSELRVGNRLNFQFNPEQKEQTVTVAWVSDDSVGYKEQHEASYPQSPKSFSGIPLTPEWLEKFGFTIETIPDSVDDEGDIIKGYTHWTNGSFCFHFSDGRVEGREHIQSVHLFQNWYYFSAFEELQINS
jgi:hypothetical protein